MTGTLGQHHGLQPYLLVYGERLTAAHHNAVVTHQEISTICGATVADYL